MVFFFFLVPLSEVYQVASVTGGLMDPSVHYRSPQGGGSPPHPLNVAYPWKRQWHRGAAEGQQGGQGLISGSEHTDRGPCPDRASSSTDVLRRTTGWEAPRAGTTEIVNRWAERMGR